MRTMTKTSGIAYLHIGLEKTGTTSLQEFFYLNRNKLKKEYNIYYPKSPGKKNHIALPIYSYREQIRDLRRQKNLTEDDDLLKFRQQFKKDLANEVTPFLKQGYNLLFSNEHLSSLSMNKEELQNLNQLFLDLNCQVKVIIYLRRQDKFLVSTYSTWLKDGSTSELRKKAYRRKRYNYLFLLDMWSEVIGDEHIIVEVFEKERFKNSSLYANFCSKIGIQDIQEFILPSKQLNKSLDKYQLQLLLAYNRLVPDSIGDEKNKFREKLIEFLEIYSTKEKLTLSDSLVRTINEHYKEDNNIIAQRFFKNIKGSLFSDSDIPDGIEEDKEDTMTDIYTVLWPEKSELYNQLLEKQKQIQILEIASNELRQDVQLNVPLHLRRGSFQKNQSVYISNGKNIFKYLSRILEIDLENSSILHYGGASKLAQSIIQFDIPIKFYHNLVFKQNIVQFLSQRISDKRIKITKLDLFHAKFNKTGNQLDTNRKSVPEEQNKYELVIAIDILTTSEKSDLEILLKEFFRILKPNGKLFFTCLVKGDLESQYAMDPSNPIRIFYKEEYIKLLLINCGFQDVKYFPPNKSLKIKGHFISSKKKLSTRKYTSSSVTAIQ